MVRANINDSKTEAANLEKRVRELLDRERWTEAKRIMETAVRTANRGESLAYAKEVNNRYMEIIKGKNPYQEGSSRNLSYLSIFFGLVFGALFLSGVFTGNVVGGTSDGSLRAVGFVFVGLGILGYFVFKKK